MQHCWVELEGHFRIRNWRMSRAGAGAGRREATAEQDQLEEAADQSHPAERRQAD
jgi:hypothetical protein